MAHVQKCFINGVKYECRTCFDPGSTVCFISEESVKSKTWRDLLQEIIKLKISDDDLLPKTICCKCSDVLKEAYNLMQQAHAVHKKYMQILKISNDPLREGAFQEPDSYADCLEESTIDIPLDQYIPEIKMEEDIGDQYNIIMLDKLLVQENNGTKVENEGELGPQLVENTVEASIEIDKEKRIYTISQLMEDHSADEAFNDQNNIDASGSSSDESDYLPLKRVKKESIWHSQTIMNSLTSALNSSPR